MVTGSEASSLRLASPSGLALDSEGNLYIADGLLDQSNGRILRIEHGRQGQDHLVEPASPGCAGVPIA